MIVIDYAERITAMTLDSDAIRITVIQRDIAICTLLP